MGLSLSREHHAIFVVLCHSILLFDPRREHSPRSAKRAFSLGRIHRAAGPPRPRELGDKRHIPTKLTPQPARKDRGGRCLASLEIG
jgi:hypothetical protein